MEHILTLVNENIQKTEFIMIKPGFLELTPTILQEMYSVGLEPVKWKTKNTHYGGGGKILSPPQG